jgi:hypothetical protein
VQGKRGRGEEGKRGRVCSMHNRFVFLPLVYAIQNIVAQCDIDVNSFEIFVNALLKCNEIFAIT